MERQPLRFSFVIVNSIMVFVYFATDNTLIRSHNAGDGKQKEQSGEQPSKQSVTALSETIILVLCLFAISNPTIHLEFTIVA